MATTKEGTDEVFCYDYPIFTSLLLFVPYLYIYLPLYSKTLYIPFFEKPAAARSSPPFLSPPITLLLASNSLYLHRHHKQANPRTPRIHIHPHIHCPTSERVTYDYVRADIKHGIHPRLTAQPPIQHPTKRLHIPLLLGQFLGIEVWRIVCRIRIDDGDPAGESALQCTVCVEVELEEAQWWGGSVPAGIEDELPVAVRVGADGEVVSVVGGAGGCDDEIEELGWGEERWGGGGGNG